MNSDIMIKENMTEDIIESSSEQFGEYSQELLIDKRKLKQIQKENFSLSNYSGFRVNLLEKFGIRTRKHHLFYGLNIQERALEVSQTSNKIMIPLLAKKDIQDKLQKIKPEIRNTLGWIHIGAIQIIIKSTFKEGLNTPIDLAIMDNRIQNREEACLGILRGNLQYRKLKFNIYPRISYHMQDRDFDKTLSLIQDFKRKDFFNNMNRPYSITYMISFALSNSHHSDCFIIKDTIDFPYLFNDVSQVQMPSLPKIQELEDSPLSLDLRPKPLITSNQNIPRLSFIGDRVISNRYERHSDNRETTYKINGEYFDGIKFSPITISISTIASGNYINEKFCTHLQQLKLENPHHYINFDGGNKEIDMAIETFLRFQKETIPIKLLIKDDNPIDMLEIILGLDFLEMVKPYNISTYGLKLTYNNQIIYIPR